MVADKVDPEVFINDESKKEIVQQLELLLDRKVSIESIEPWKHLETSNKDVKLPFGLDNEEAKALLEVHLTLVRAKKKEKETNLTKESNETDKTKESSCQHLQRVVQQPT